MCISYSNRIIIRSDQIIRLGQPRETLASWKYITIELKDGLPTALSDVHGPDQDDLLFRDPSTGMATVTAGTGAADPPIWLFTGKSLGVL